LIEKTLEDLPRMACDACGFIDWNNWMNPAAVVVAFNEQNEFAVVRMQEDGTLSFPQGYRELGETVIEAARRETLEEIGYAVHDLKLYDIYEMDSKRLLWIIFTARLGEGTLCQMMKSPI
jgi:8-oxo-dGTP pyrophosphatase MutT (NUDIX family)